MSKFAVDFECIGVSMFHIAIKKLCATYYSSIKSARNIIHKYK